MWDLFSPTYQLLFTPFASVFFMHVSTPARLRSTVSWCWGERDVAMVLAVGRCQLRLDGTENRIVCGHARGTAGLSVQSACQLNLRLYEGPNNSLSSLLYTPDQKSCCFQKSIGVWLDCVDSIAWCRQVPYLVALPSREHSDSQKPPAHLYPSTANWPLASSRDGGFSASSAVISTVLVVKAYPRSPCDHTGVRCNIWHQLSLEPVFKHLNLFCGNRLRSLPGKSFMRVRQNHPC